MDRPDKMLIAVDAGALDSIRAELAEIKALLQRATVTPAPDWVSIGEAARIRGVSTSTIRRWIDLGQLEATGTGKARRIKIN